MRKRLRKEIHGDKPIGRLKEASDFLPPPESLVSPEEVVKVTISLDRRSLEFFRHAAAKLGTKYQRMIRELIRSYAAHYS